MSAVPPKQQNFSTNEFFRMSLEQYLLLKSSLLKTQLDEATTNEQKRCVIEEFISEFIGFAKQVLGRNSKQQSILIAELIEKAFIIEFSLLRKKSSEDLSRSTANRNLKVYMLGLPRMDLHLIQLFARLECLKLMYEFLTVSEKVPKGFNYREKFESDLSRHLDQIKVIANMSPDNASSPLDSLLLGLFKQLLQGCTCIEFYTFLNNFSIRNDLSKPVKKHLRSEYESLSTKYSKHPQQSQSQFKSASAITPTSTNMVNEHPSHSQNLSNNVDAGMEQQRMFRQQSRLMEVEENNLSNNVPKSKKDFFNNSNALHYQENTQFNLLDHLKSSSSQSQKNTSQSTSALTLSGFSEAISNSKTLFAAKSSSQSQQQELNSKADATTPAVNAANPSNDDIDNIRLLNLNLNNNHNTASNNIPNTNNTQTQQKGIQQKSLSSNAPARSLTLTKPILQSGRTMYSLLNKKVVRNSQSSTSSKTQQNPNKQPSKNHSSKSAINGSSSSINKNNNNNSNILFEAASKLLLEQDNKRQSQLKLMSRESNKPILSETNGISKNIKSPSAQETFIIEGFAETQQQQQQVSAGEDENSMPLMFMWGHN